MQRLAWVLAAATFGVHAAVAGRYDFFRDELYFIACGRHPAFGYVDQPPLIPLLAAGTQLAGHDLIVLRLIAAAAAAATVLVACALTRLAGGGAFALLLAGLCAGFAPMLLGMHSLLTTSTFEPLGWTLLAYAFARVLVLEDERALIWAGAVAGITLEAKYGLAAYLIGLGLAFAILPERRAVLRPQLALGAALGIALGAPSVIWQAVHGFPFVELVQAATSGKNVVYAPLAVVLQQIMTMNPFSAPVWIAGAFAPFAVTALRPLRVLSLAFLLTFAVLVVTHAKDYYFAPLYPAMFALGAVAIERWVRQPIARGAYVAAILALSAFAAPTVLAMLSPTEASAYMRATGLAPKIQEKSMLGEVLPQTFSDQLAWRDFVQSVADVYEALPPQDRARAAIITGNYGEAAAIDFYGPALGLPPALSGHNAYWGWGTHGYDGSVVLRVNGNLARYRTLCREATVAGTFGTPLAMPYERGPIILCRELHRPLAQMWGDFRHIE